MNRVTMERCLEDAYNILVDFRAYQLSSPDIRLNNLVKVAIRLFDNEQP